MQDFNPYELLYMSRLGDPFAFEALFKQYSGALYGVVSACTEGYYPLRPYKEDIYQEASIIFVAAIDSYREDMNAGFATYFQILARRRVWNICRSYARQFANFGDIISLDEVISDDETYYETIPQRYMMNDPVYVMEYNDAKDRLNRLVDEMNPKDLEALKAWIDGEPYQAGADRLGITYKAWDARRLRVRKKIRSAVFNH